jgi:hypothetical protein
MTTIDVARPKVGTARDFFFERWRLLGANISNNAQEKNELKSITSTVQMSGAK